MFLHVLSFSTVADTAARRQSQLGPKPLPLLAQEQRHPVLGERTPLRSRPPPLTPTLVEIASFHEILQFPLKSVVSHK